MKTTLDLPDELMRTIKIRAAREDRRLKDLIAELLREGLESRREEPRVKHRVQFPLIQSTHPALPGEGLTPDQIDEILLAEEARWALGNQ